MKTVAKKIGARYALLFNTIGLFIAFIIFGLMIESFNELIKFIIKLLPNFSLGILVSYFVSYYLGIVTAKSNNKEFMGIVTAISAVTLGTIGGSLIAFFQEGVFSYHFSFDENIIEIFVDYIVKPLFWISIFGCIPSIILGLIYGSVIRNKLNNLVK